MKHGKHARKSNLRWKRSFVLLTALTVLMLGVVGATISYLVTSTEPVTNTFEYAEVTCEVNETFENDVKSYVTIKNTGKIDAYIRAAVIVTWKDKDGNVYGQPVSTNAYTIQYNETGWTHEGDYWYCNKAIAADASTDPLIVRCAKTDKANPPAGYDLSVEILADAIQSQPANAVQQAWGFDPSSN